MINKPLISEDPQLKKALSSWKTYWNGIENTAERNKESFNEREEDYFSHTTKPTVAKNNRVINDIIVENSPLKGNILDVGCADGQRTLKFSENLNPHGIDFSYNMAKSASKRGINSYVANMMQLPFKNKKFDVLTCLNGTLGHLQTEKDRELAFQEFFRTLNKNGKLILDVFGQQGYWQLHTKKHFDAMQQSQPKNSSQKFSFGDTMYSVGDESNVCFIRHFKEGEIDKLASKTGFKIKKFSTVGYGTYKGIDYGGKINEDFNKGSLVYVLEKD